ncbi:2Fe-2S iron-sulfur cluster binding domain-containing protein [Kyrpidia tusciae]|uniref:Ferredoxin n=1 Tax=Kyrpidia tusciae (strain DSM 2912 / NBRC 15312 / T2) TaxID=562970 RepID=D5WSJ5_KYRT2|nr:2Fe-2S iron-sulfur cluster binding domain-containing protein [Kyrpidia tusciae]ADG07014.1 ferredoxin [Kyrpidia tusciae DSM 2912]
MRKYRIQIFGEGDDHPQILDCEEGEVITDAAERAGILIRVTCANGGCGACRAEVVEGMVGYTGPVSRKKRVDPATGNLKYELLCRATPLSDVVVRPLNGWKQKKQKVWAEIRPNPISGGGTTCQ